MKRIFLAILFLFIVAAPIPEKRVAFRATTPPYLTIFMIDGLSQTVFKSELEAGHLPQMEALIQEGTYVENGVSAFPSMTAYGFYPFLTGRDAVQSGVLGSKKFRRRHLTDWNHFEKLPPSGS